MRKYEDFFTGLGCVHGGHHIQVNLKVPPVIHPPTEVPVALKKDIKTELKQMASPGGIKKPTE